MSRILVISQKNGFMSDALQSNLKEAGFAPIQVEPDIRRIAAQKEEIDLILLLAGEYVYDTPEVLVYLTDICRDEGRPLCLIGYGKELGTIRKYIPEAFIKREFERPFDPKYVAAGLTDLAAEAEEKRLGKHILLVDDDTLFLKTLRGWLSGKYRITAVKSGIQAITYMANHRPDLILLDYDMPITTGPQVMEMIKSEHDYRDIPIIFLTGKSDRKSIMDVMRLKPAGYLLKSTPRDEIVAAIDAYFAAHRWDGA